jgi:hypothetical protein
VFPVEKVNQDPVAGGSALRAKSNSSSVTETSGRVGSRMPVRKSNTSQTALHNYNLWRSVSCS